MERRFVLFLLLAFLIFTGYISLIQTLYPPKKPQAKGEVAAKNEAEKAEKPKEAEKEKEAGQKEEQGKVAQPEAEKTAAAEEKKPQQKKTEEEEKTPEEAPEEAGPPEQWISLGSADPKDPYRMQVTLTNRGAALARIELSSSRYRETDDRSGYLGNLVMDKNLPGPGQPVQVVGAGTPADKAGIKIGDIILEINGKPVTSFSSLENENSLAEKLALGQSAEEKKNILEHTRRADY